MLKRSKNSSKTLALKLNLNNKFLFNRTFGKGTLHKGLFTFLCL